MSVESCKFIGRGARGCTYIAKMNGERVIVQVVLDDMLLSGTEGTPEFLQLGAPGFVESYGDESVIVSRVPQGEMKRICDMGRSVLVDIVRVFRSMEERNLAMVEFDYNSLIATNEGTCLVDIGCTVCRKDKPFEYLDLVSGCPPDDSFDYDQNTVWRLGKLVASIDSVMSQPLLDLLRDVFRPRTKRITLKNLLLHPYFVEFESSRV